jgi:creatinine amidohydrolase
MYTNQPAPRLHSETRQLVILPIGSCEQHGPYLPIDTDLRIAQLLAERLAQSFTDTNTLLLPAIPFSCSWEHKGLGTLALNVSTLAAVINDVAHSLKTWRIPVLLILVNWHGGNDILAPLATEITARESIPTAVIPAISQIGKAWEESHITNAKDVHAGAVETSVIQAYWPDLIAGPIPETAHCEPAIAPAKTQAVMQALGTHAVTKSGIWGAPEQIDAKKGESLITALTEAMHEQTARLLELVNTQHYSGYEWEK